MYTQWSHSCPPSSPVLLLPATLSPPSPTATYTTATTANTFDSGESYDTFSSVAPALVHSDTRQQPLTFQPDQSQQSTQTASSGAGVLQALDGDLVQYYPWQGPSDDDIALVNSIKPAAFSISDSCDTDSRNRYAGFFTLPSSTGGGDDSRGPFVLPDDGPLLDDGALAPVRDDKQVAVVDQDEAEEEGNSAFLSTLPGTAESSSLYDANDCGAADIQFSCTDATSTFTSGSTIDDMVPGNIHGRADSSVSAWISSPLSSGKDISSDDEHKYSQSGRKRKRKPTRRNNTTKRRKLYHDHSDDEDDVDGLYDDDDEDFCIASTSATDSGDDDLDDDDEYQIDDEEEFQPADVFTAADSSAGRVNTRQSSPIISPNPSETLERGRGRSVRAMRKRARSVMVSCLDSVPLIKPHPRKSTHCLICLPGNTEPLCVSQRELYDQLRTPALRDALLRDSHLQATNASELFGVVYIVKNISATERKPLPLGQQRFKCHTRKQGWQYNIPRSAISCRVHEWTEPNAGKFTSYHFYSTKKE